MKIIKKSFYKLRGLWITLLVIVIPIGGYFGVKEIQDENPLLNLEVVVPGKLIRSGQPAAEDIDDIDREYGINTILCLNRREKEWVREYAKAEGIKVLGMEMSADDPPTDDQLRLFFDMLSGDTVDLTSYGDAVVKWSKSEPLQLQFEQPILVHCIGGSDRTGVMVALYRITYQGWTKEQAKKEMMMHMHIPPVHPALFQYINDFDPDTWRKKWNSSSQKNSK